MAKISPFRAIRPVPNKVHLVTTRSYISYTKDQLKKKLAANPFSFIHVLNPDGASTTKSSLKDKFKKVAEKFKSFIHKDYFVKDEEPCLYIYRQIKQGRSYTGIVGLVSLDEYKNSTIKKHELTLEDREEMFKDYLQETQIHAEPVLLTYKKSTEIDSYIQNQVLETPIYAFVTHDEVLHELWCISKPEALNKIEDLFKEIPSFYIADGHHRSASSMRLYADSRKEKYNKFLAYLLADDQLLIKGYHRILDLKENQLELFPSLLERLYTCRVVGEKELDINANVYVYYQKKWMELIPKETTHQLPVEYLTEHLIQEGLKIKDVRLSKQIKYLDSSASLEQLKEKTAILKNGIALVLPPITAKDLMHVSDAGKILPPKSTWIEPKLRSALIIYSYDNKD